MDHTVALVIQWAFAVCAVAVMLSVTAVVVSGAIGTLRKGASSE